ncbi:MAG: crossover junction endodeoxyribonuclease RuvC [Planctomycetes bacterium]|nr:crossover junction endodeoxyribonuclease RuvC [Planctomycetota bacterium]
MTETTRILGIDPGTRMAGWGVLESSSPPRRLASGALRLGDRQSLPDRLLALRDGVEALLDEWLPNEVAIEDAFIGRNARSAMRLGEARGVIIAAVRGRGIPLREWTPAEVKRRVAGSGTASKELVARYVASQLSVHEEFGSFDESDSLAIALCSALEWGDTRPHDGITASRLPPGFELQ